jgi:hypothetical protein
MNNFTLQMDVCEITPIEAHGNKGSVNSDTTGIILTHLKNGEIEVINEIHYRPVTGTDIFLVLQDLYIMEICVK